MIEKPNATPPADASLPPPNAAVSESPKPADAPLPKDAPAAVEAPKTPEAPPKKRGGARKGAGRPKGSTAPKKKRTLKKGPSVGPSLFEGKAPAERAAVVEEAVRAGAKDIPIEAFGDTRTIAAIVVEGLDSIVVSVGEKRYGPRAALLSADDDKKQMMIGAGAAYLASLEVQVTPLQALLTAVLFAYGGAVAALEMSMADAAREESPAVN